MSNAVYNLTGSNESSVSVPFLTATQRRWAGSQSNVNGSTVSGAPVLPANSYGNLSSVASPQQYFAILNPTDNAEEVLNKYSLVYLLPGAVYKWSSVNVYRPVQIEGRGATVVFAGYEGPSLLITGDSETGDKSFRIILRDINFVGGQQPDRGEPMQERFSTHVGVWFSGLSRCTISNCSFINYKGCALMFSSHEVPAGGLYVSSAQHVISGCRFVSNRVAICTDVATAGSLAVNNCFRDCQVCFWVNGGGWQRTGNLISNSRCAYLHTNQNSTWWSGDTASAQGLAQDSFTGNTLQYCDYACEWPNQLVVNPEGDTITLSGFYFNNQQSYPPVWVGNNHMYADVKIIDFKTELTKYCLVGNMFIGTDDGNTGGVYVADALKDKVYLIGCYGTQGVKIYNVPNANCTPTVGTSVTGDLPQRAHQATTLQLQASGGTPSNGQGGGTRKKNKRNSTQLSGSSDPSESMES